MPAIVHSCILLVVPNTAVHVQTHACTYGPIRCRAFSKILQLIQLNLKTKTRVHVSVSILT